VNFEVSSKSPLNEKLSLKRAKKNKIKAQVLTPAVEFLNNPDMKKPKDAERYTAKIVTIKIPTKLFP